MSSIDAKLIKELREKSGAGMMDCKKALGETSGNIEKAIDWLRKKGLSKASKKADRVTAEGVVAIEFSELAKEAILVEINSETDFVARNDMFQNFAKTVAKTALTGDGVRDNLVELKLETGESIQEHLVSLIATIGENITIRRAAKITGKYLSSYIHNVVAEGLGKIGVIVALDSESKNKDLGKQLAMHIASNKPLSLDITSLDPKSIEREKSVQREIAKQSGKPDNIIEKMLEGRIQKFYQEVCLLEQPFLMDPDKTVKKVLQENGTNISSFAFFVLGEGIEKETVDFAKEVADSIK